MVWWSVFLMVGSFFTLEPLPLVVSSGLTVLLYLFSASTAPGTFPAPSAKHSLLQLRPTGEPVRFFLICSSSLLILVTSNSRIPPRQIRPEGERAGKESPRVSHSARSSERYRTLPFVYSLRGKIGRSLEDRSLAQSSRALLRALILADRSRLDGRLRESYGYLGIAHFLALSGLHLGILILPLGWIFNRLRLGKCAADTLLFLILGLFTAVAGYPPSLLRALALWGAVKSFQLLGLHFSLIRCLLAGSFLLAGVDLSIIHNRGFQLSFIAVAGIALLGLPIQRMITSRLPGGWKGRIAQILIFPLVVSCSVNLFSLVLVLSLFGRASLMAPLVNLVIIIPLTLLLYSGMIYILLPGAGLKRLLSGWINLLSDLLHRIPASISSFPHPGIQVGELDYVSYVLTVSCLVIAVRPRTPRRRLLLLFAFLSLLCSVVLAPRDRSGGARPVDFPPGKRRSGGGDWPRGENVLFGKERILVIKGRLNENQARFLVGDLWRRGTGKLRYLIVVCAEGKQVGGLQFLLRRMRPDSVICSPYLEHSLEWPVAEIEKFGSRYLPLEEDLRLLTGGGWIEIHAPPFPPAAGHLDLQRTELRVSFPPPPPSRK
ncbi:MAG: ComEC/Rec2 family competence protein [Candidatus Krumholzibacteriota bacterium]|nr:ComEC/Rec2 family competence protein [Candidatus Krumholzibacteriota bacterium]